MSGLWVSDEHSNSATPQHMENGEDNIDSFDPFRIFELTQPECLILTVRVKRGRRITKGFLWDLIDWPDPYIRLRVNDTPEGVRWTKCKSNDCNPIWCEEFEFCLPTVENRTMTICLMEANYGPDSLIASLDYDLSELPIDNLTKKTFSFHGHGEVDMEFHLRKNAKPDIRISLCLSDEEKKFRELRLKRVLECMQVVLDDKAPTCLDEVPVIAVLGSGGGFRALTSFTGVLKALEDMRLLDCVTYISALSGSSWALSSLYAHPDWPEKGVADIQMEIRESVSHSPLRLLRPHSLYRYMERVLEKRRCGQPVSFTDFFGMMVGETLLRKSPNARLSEQKGKLRNGRVPLPIYSCVHVKKDVSARVFQEWVEFTPYEVGLPKYACFLPSSDFGAKYYLGHKVKHFPEPPLHYLQGLWGSAFCILFDQLFTMDADLFDKSLDPEEIQRRIIAKRQAASATLDSTTGVKFNRGKRESLASILEDCETLNRSLSVPFNRNSSDEVADIEHLSSGWTDSCDVKPPLLKTCRSCLENRSEYESFAHSSTTRSSASSRKSSSGSAAPSASLLKSAVVEGTSSDSSDSEANFEVTAEKDTEQVKKTYKMRRAQSGFWMNMIEKLCTGNRLLNDNTGRAAVIHNFMRGLGLANEFPLTPFNPMMTPRTSTHCHHSHSSRHRMKRGSISNSSNPLIGDSTDGNSQQANADEPSMLISNDERDFVELYTPGPQLQQQKHMYMVDAGLTFNSPFPSVLRQQRGVDLILSFDFSARRSDSYPPFQEILLAYKWTLLHRIPFPKITMDEFHKDGMKEVYIFRDLENPRSPILMHFVLTNTSFKHFKAPGVVRSTDEEKEFGNFSIFDDPESPYSTFNFTYHPVDFDRLSHLTEYNTRICERIILDCMAACVEKRRNHLLSTPIDLNLVKELDKRGGDIAAVPRRATIVREGSVEKLKHFLERKESQHRLNISQEDFSVPGSPPKDRGGSNTKTTGTDSLPTVIESDAADDSDGLADLPDSPSNTAAKYFFNSQDVWTQYVAVDDEEHVRNGHIKT